MATHYAVTCPDGSVVTRSTASRAYSHVVVVRASYENAMRRAVAVEWEKSDRKNYGYYVEQSKRLPTPDMVQWQRDALERDAKLVAENPTVEAYVASQRAKRVAWVEDAKAKGEYDTFGAYGWCGRANMLAGLQIIVTSAALADTDERLFPASKHRSARVLKKLKKRFGGEFRKVGAIFRAGNQIIMHPTRHAEFMAEMRRRELEDLS